MSEQASNSNDTLTTHPYAAPIRWFQRLMIWAWHRSHRRGDPPPFVQRAFDRESVRLLTGTLIFDPDPHTSDCGIRYEEDCDCSARFIGFED